MKTSNNTKKIPIEIIEELAKEIDGICHGSVHLEIILRDNHFARFIIKKETSLLASDFITGGKKCNS
jgi:hypothetical protein